MCGIVGFMTWGAPIPPGVLEQATLSLAHRGPDDSGTVVLQPTQPQPMEIGLGHRRLAILDLSPLGHQPMHDPSTGNWIVYNGEIYNFRSLRQELEAAGAKFKSNSDTEVILAAYRLWGQACLTRLGGMFAFALWDEPRKRMLLARDPMGIKPLYYHQSGQTFMFASEIRTLLRTGLLPRRADPTALISYLAFGSVYEPYTIVAGIRSLPPGHFLTVEPGSLSVREYWSPLQTVAMASDETPSSVSAVTTARLPVVLREAVVSHLVSDVPVGVFLSGGIDSSALVALLSHHGVRASTFSLVFREDEFNEAQYSREVASRFATDHHEIPTSEQDVLDSLPQALCAMDQPTIDGVNTYLVSAKTRAAGVKVALTGLGSDEMFAGYSNFRRVPHMEHFARRFARLPRLARRPLSASLALFAGKGDRGRKLAELAAEHDTVVHPYFLARELFSSGERHQLFAFSDDATHDVANAHVSDAEQALANLLQESTTRSARLDPVNRVSYLESYCYMRNTLLRDSDFMSMAHGLELRVPFLDRPLVEACFAISGARKLSGRMPKSLLLSSLGVDLPPAIVDRPKRGFTLPFERWLRNQMRQPVEAALLNSGALSALFDPQSVRAVWNRFLAGETSWSRPWSLFVLERWLERNL